jgi:hypothetical protein
MSNGLFKPFFILQRHFPTRCGRLRSGEETMTTPRTQEEQYYLEMAKAHLVLRISITGCTPWKAKATMMSTSPIAPKVR